MCLKRLDSFFEDKAMYLNNIQWGAHAVKSCNFFTWHCRFLEYIPVVRLLPAVVHLLAYALRTTTPEEALPLKGRVKNDSWGHGSRGLACALPFGNFALIIHDIALSCRKTKVGQPSETTPLQRTQEQRTPSQNQKTLCQALSISTKTLEEAQPLEQPVVTKLSMQSFEKAHEDENKKKDDGFFPLGLSESTKDTLVFTEKKIFHTTLEIEIPRFDALAVRQKLLDADLEVLKAVIDDHESMLDALLSLGVAKVDRENLTLADLKNIIIEIETNRTSIGQVKSPIVPLKEIIALLSKKFPCFSDEGVQHTQAKAMRIYSNLSRLPLNMLRETHAAAHVNYVNYCMTIKDYQSNTWLNAHDKSRQAIYQLMRQAAPELSISDCRKFNEAELVWLLNAILSEAEQAAIEFINNPKNNQILIEI